MFGRTRGSEVSYGKRQQAGVTGPFSLKRQGVSAGWQRPERSISNRDEACFGTGSVALRSASASLPHRGQNPFCNS